MDVPHALGFDGFRWHARAWCHKCGGFVDFVLARIVAVGGTKPSDTDPKLDIAWEREIALRFVPHPDLEDGKRKAVEMDYGMMNGFAEITTRVCMSYYLELQFGLDLDSSQSKGERRQFVLVNTDELEAARNEVVNANSVSATKTEKHEELNAGHL